jgi:hypothetical protein
MESVVDKVRKANIDAGVDPKVMKSFIKWEEPFMKKHYREWLSAVTNPRTGKFWQIQKLIDEGIIPEDEEYEPREYPYRKLNSLMKVSHNGQLFIQRNEMWTGLTKAGQEFSISVNDLDYYVKPTVTYEYTPKDPSIPDGPSIRVGIIKGWASGNEPYPGNRIYLTPYSKERVDECLKYATTEGDPTSLLLVKPGINPCSVTYEQFISEEDFDSTFERIRRPVPTFNDFFRDLKTKEEQAKKDSLQYQ